MRLGVVVAAGALAAMLLTAMILAVCALIDRSVILRFIAPTAFETRSIEEILEGDNP